MCKTKTHTPMSAFHIYLDNKMSSSGIAPMKNPPCFDKLDKAFSDKLNIFPNHLFSPSGLQNQILKNKEEEENLEMDLKIILLDSHHHPANTLCKPNVILRKHFLNLRKLLSA